MAALSLSFLGPFLVQLGNQPLTQFESDKVRALLAYLAVESGKPHRRSALAGLLWPDSTESAARASLRNALANLRLVIQDQRAYPPYLLIDSETIQWNPASDYWLDVVAFEQPLKHAPAPSSSLYNHEKIDHLNAAVLLYHGAFLQGFSLKDSPEFEQWSRMEKESLQRKAVSILSYLALAFEQSEDIDQACAYAFRQVALEPWHEEGHRQLMRLLALNGQRADALAQYETCRRSLEEELGIEPEEATIQLYEQIRDGEIQGIPKNKLPNHNLPVMAPGLVGREVELQALLTRFEDPSCQLLTVVGAGGCGKTRLAIEAARRLVGRFRNGVYFASLVEIQTPREFPQAIARVLGFSFRPEIEPWRQIMDYLRHKEVLLILDNFEHILEGASQVVELLNAAREVKILVTSRVQLNLIEECLFPLEGLAYPSEGKAESMTQALDSYPAIQLFLHGAQRVKPGYTPGGEDLEHIGVICRQVAGMPLAVLLSASWAGILSPAEITAQIRQRSLDFLETEWRDLPDRQRSLRAVFDHSWDLLSKRQQEFLAGLSIFPGSFPLPAACAVTQFELHDLHALIYRSVVQRASSDRFELHMLWRQFIAAKYALPSRQERSILHPALRLFY